MSAGRVFVFGFFFSHAAIGYIWSTWKITKTTEQA